MIDAPIETRDGEAGCDPRERREHAREVELPRQLGRVVARTIDAW
jgi:hypothetical protein